MPSVLTHGRALLVEGADEQGFFRGFFKHLGIADIDVKRFVRLIKGEITFQQAWGWAPHWYPAWCRKN
jgi:hypothetical protein